VESDAEQNQIYAMSCRQLRRAAGIKDKIDVLQKKLGRILGTAAAESPVAKVPRKKRKMSAAAKKKIPIAAKARWAKAKAAKK
jgi:hypothetical protein